MNRQQIVDGGRKHQRTQPEATHHDARRRPPEVGEPTDPPRDHTGIPEGDARAREQPESSRKLPERAR